MSSLVGSGFEVQAIWEGFFLSLDYSWSVFQVMYPYGKAFHLEGISLGLVLMYGSMLSWALKATSLP